MSRSRRAARRGQAATPLPAWPLDPPRPADRGQQTTVTPPAPGAVRPGRRVFFCKGCRRGVEATDCPDRWLRVQVHDAATQARDGRTFLTVALFCGMPCLQGWAAASPEVSV